MQDHGRRLQPEDRRDEATDDEFVAPDPVPVGEIDRDSDAERGSEPELVRLPSTVAHQPISGVVAAAVAGILVLAVGLYATTRTPTDDTIPMFRATDLIFWVLGAVAIAVATIGTQFAELSARSGAVALGQATQGRGTPLAWVLPGCATLASVLLIATWHNVPVALIGAILTVVSVVVALLVRDLFDDLTDSAVRVAVLVHGVTIHLVAFIGLATLYHNKLPAWLTALLVAVFAGLLIVEALGRAPLRDVHRIGMAALGGLVVAQAAVVIERWPTWGWTGGIALLVTFFVANGLLVTWAVTRNVARRDVGYYAGLGAIGLAMIALFAL
ncbi:MAG TPA: hypothetical protein VGT61_08435 [Thermomicrobiales bacterium]|nr:hypothetical protein [Thermomicrobiales bacterium]